MGTNFCREQNLAVGLLDGWFAYGLTLNRGEMECFELITSRNTYCTQTGWEDVMVYWSVTSMQWTPAKVLSGEPFLLHHFVKEELRLMTLESEIKSQSMLTYI